jgi:hypothetical protein
MLNIASIFMGTDNKILKHLERDSEWLQQQLGQYGPISGDFVTKFAYETLPTPITIGKSIMVRTRSCPSYNSTYDIRLFLKPLLWSLALPMPSLSRSTQTIEI